MSYSPNRVIQKLLTLLLCFALLATLISGAFNASAADNDVWYSKSSFADAMHKLAPGSTGVLDIQYDVTPLRNMINGVTSYADTTTDIGAYSHMGIIIRMYTNGFFDARNGNTYEEMAVVPYIANETYHIKITADLNAQTFDAWVTPPNSEAVLIADDYAFRSDAPAINELGTISLYSVTDNAFKISNHIVSPAVLDTQAPTAPTDVYAALMPDHAVDLSWTASADNVYLTGYKVYRDGAELGNTLDTTFTDTGLETNTQYSYTVRAYDAAGNLSPASPSLSITTNEESMRLGLFHTSDELLVWRQRAMFGPYKTNGDSSSNSPGDWTRIVSNKDTFMAEPTAGRYDPSWGEGCVPTGSAGQAYDPKLREAGRLRDAAFYALIKDDAATARAVIDELVEQAKMANADFSDTSRWCPDLVNDNHPFFMTGEWLSKLFIAYGYVDQWTKHRDKMILDQWFRDAGDMFITPLVNSFDSRFADRQNGDYTPIVDNASTKTPFYGSSVEVGHYGRIYNNRYGDIWQFLALVGIEQDIPYYKEQAKQWVKEYLMFGVYADNFVSEFYRWEKNNPDKGLAYAYSVLGFVWNIAEAFARIGDTELYEFETSDGVFGSEGSPEGYSGKSIRYTIQLMGDYGNGRTVRYGTDDPARNGDLSYRIDGYNPNQSYQQNQEIFASITNQYFKDDYIKAMYTRTGIGRQPYFAKPNDIGNSATVWEGSGGLFPGMLFMYGQMEGKVNPYPLN